jgi:DNA adenine methylase
MRLPLFIVKTAGTKGWFVPHALEFLGDWRPTTIVEPFAGSGIVGLSLLYEGLADRLVLAEKDNDYLAFWRAALSDSNFSYRVSKWTDRVLDLPFEQQKPFVEASLETMEREDRGFWILLRSRIGYNGKKVGGYMTEKSRGGILCRWPRTLDLSLEALQPPQQDHCHGRCFRGADFFRQ